MAQEFGTIIALLPDCSSSLSNSCKKVQAHALLAMRVQSCPLFRFQAPTALTQTACIIHCGFLCEVEILPSNKKCPSLRVLGHIICSNKVIQR